MYIKISFIIFDYILPINFFYLSDYKKADTTFTKTEEILYFESFSTTPMSQTLY